MTATSTVCSVADESRRQGAAAAAAVEGFDSWGIDRRIIAAQQLFCRIDNIEVGRSTASPAASRACASMSMSAPGGRRSR